MNKNISVLLFEPGEKARMVEIEDSLEAMQKLVGGYIEEYMPFEDEVAIVCNEEGKLRNMELNRAIRDKRGQVMDVIAGPFFIAYAPIDSETYLTFPPDLEEKYKKKFELPERFFGTPDNMKVMTFEPKETQRTVKEER